MLRKPSANYSEIRVASIVKLPRARSSTLENNSCFFTVGNAFGLRKRIQNSKYYSLVAVKYRKSDCILRNICQLIFAFLAAVGTPSAISIRSETSLCFSLSSPHVFINGNK